MTREEVEKLIKELIEKTGVSIINISSMENAGDNMWFSVEVAEPHFFVMREGEALNSLNHLVRKIVESKIGEKSGVADKLANNILIDVNGFQKKRIDGVRAIAHMMGERARYFKSNIEIDPMSAFERRIIHEFFSEATDLKTESVGMGPSRRVVIKYVGQI